MNKYCKIVIACLTATVFLAFQQGDWAVTKAKKDWKKLHPNCQLCGHKPSMTQPNEAHHLIPININPDLGASSTNFVTLCRTHHIWIGHAGDMSCRKYCANVTETIEALKKERERVMVVEPKEKLDIGSVIYSPSVLSTSEINTLYTDQTNYSVGRYTIFNESTIIDTCNARYVVSNGFLRLIHDKTITGTQNINIEESK